MCKKVKPKNALLKQYMMKKKTSKVQDETAKNLLKYTAEELKQQYEEQVEIRR